MNQDKRQLRKHPKKLRLHKEMLRNLTSSKLELVKGGDDTICETFTGPLCEMLTVTQQ